MMLRWDKDPVVPTYIVRMEDLQKKAEWAGRPIKDNWLVNVASKSLLSANTLPSDRQAYQNI